MRRRTLFGKTQAIVFSAESNVIYEGFTSGSQYIAITSTVDGVSKGWTYTSATDRTYSVSKSGNNLYVYWPAHASRYYHEKTITLTQNDTGRTLTITLQQPAQTFEWENGSNLLTLTFQTSGTIDVNMYDHTLIAYKKNSGSWVELAENTNSSGTVKRQITVAANDVIQFQGFYAPSYDYNPFFGDTTGNTNNAKCTASGNPKSMYNKNIVTGTSVYTTSNLFAGCQYNESDYPAPASSSIRGHAIHITDISGITLPGTTLSSYCYAYMFAGCPLTTIPYSLFNTIATVTYSANHQYCLKGMFFNCTSLTEIPSSVVLATTRVGYGCFEYMFCECTNLTTIYSGLLPAKGLTATYSYATECYKGMFQGCTSLTTIPNGFLPATTLDKKSYESMFQGCTSLTTIPANLLPITNLRTYGGQMCYQNMFKGCTSLTTIPSGFLPATTLVDFCYDGMFENCTSLTTIPSGLLPATYAVYCGYYNMFKGCTSLTTVPTDLLPAMSLGGYYAYYGMFENCTSLTTAPNLPATSLYGYDYTRMFKGCTSLTTAPSILPATTLKTYCYDDMFYRCSNLTTAPELPATTLVGNCYQDMFYNCSSLNYIKAMFTTTPGSSYTSNWVNGVASSGTFYKNSAATWSVTGVNGVPSGWTVRKVSS